MLNMDHGSLKKISIKWETVTRVYKACILKRMKTDYFS